ncbi:MAG: hypothetical protein J6P93_00725 [Alphaproteobacteria bacterium]|nr:hypothetical protein [Alphaproteobacteria bacterium]
MQKNTQTYSKYGLKTRTAPLMVRITPWFIPVPAKKVVSVDVMPYLGKIMETVKKQSQTADLMPQMGKILGARKKRYENASIMPQLGKILSKSRD